MSGRALSRLTQGHLRGMAALECTTPTCSSAHSCPITSYQQFEHGNCRNKRFEPHCAKPGCSMRSRALFTGCMQRRRQHAASGDAVSAPARILQLVSAQPSVRSASHLFEGRVAHITSPTRRRREDYGAALKVRSRAPVGQLTFQCCRMVTSSVARKVRGSERMYR